MKRDQALTNLDRWRKAAELLEKTEELLCGVSYVLRSDATDAVAIAIEAVEDGLKEAEGES